MKEFPLISVVTTVYNTEKYVERCIDSIMEQTYPNIELIVVNNASKGNINEIIFAYQSIYEDIHGRKIRLIQCEENLGIFKARVKGGETAEGEYIAFIDSDDRVDIDFYRILEERAEETDADIVAGNVVHEVLHENDEREVIDFTICPITSYQYEYTKDQICDIFFSQHGKENYWNLVWNKLYRRDVWERCLPLLKKQTEVLVMYDDVAFTTVFYLYTQKFTCAHNANYYYCRRSDANSVGSNDPKKFQSIFRDMQVLFRYMETVLEESGNMRYQKYIEDWKDLYFRTWCSEIDASTLPRASKHLLQKELLEQFHKTKASGTTPEDTFFYSLTGSYSSQYEELKRKIADPEIQVVSFDIFDTLIVRPFWVPTDLFHFLSEEFNRLTPKVNTINFCDIRIRSEELAREKLRTSGSLSQDITLDEIYDAMGGHFSISEDLLSRMKDFEVMLEIRYCEARNTGKELYRYACQLGKRVVAVSDMYLPKETVFTILEKNGYCNFERVFVSSETKRIKITTEMFRYVAAELKTVKPGNILHIGDNLNADYLGAMKAGWKSALLPRPIDVFQNLNQDIYAGESFRLIFQQDLAGGFNGNDFFGLRCMLAVVANRMFDNPFQSFRVDSDFNADPNYIGYYTLGMYMYGLGHWLKGHVDRENYERIHFIARDGLLLKKCFEAMYSNAAGPETNYLYISRKALFPLLIAEPTDLYSIKNYINIYTQSPKSILEMCRPIIPKDIYERREEIFEKSNCRFSIKFFDEYGFERFLHIFKEHFYWQELIDQYRDSMRAYFGEMVKGHDCTFDVGYSGRTEFVLSKLLNITLDAYYIHVFWDRAVENSKKFRFKIIPFEGFSPPAVPRTVILEKLICETGPSCTGYRFNTDKERFEPEYAECTDTDAVSAYMITVMQEAALRFVRDFTEHFGDREMTFDYSAVARPFNYFLERAKIGDQKLFACTAIADDLGLTENRTLIECWPNDPPINKELAVFSSPKWKMAIYLALFDRKTLKEKIKRRYAARPVFLKVLKTCYGALRRAYHLIKQ